MCNLMPDPSMRADKVLGSSVRSDVLREPVRRISLSHNLTGTQDSIEMDSLDAGKILSFLV